MAEYELWVDIEFREQRTTTPIPKGDESALQKLRPEDVKGMIGHEVNLVIRDPATMDNFKARLMLYPSPEDAPDGDKLQLVYTGGRLEEPPLGVKIIERIEEEEEEVKVLPTRRLTLVERKGRILTDLLKEREEKRKKKEGGK